MSKAILLNDGNYVGMGLVKFPCEVEVFGHNGADNIFGDVFVSRDELVRVGAEPDAFADDGMPWSFENGVSIEVIK